MIRRVGWYKYYRESGTVEARHTILAEAHL